MKRMYALLKELYGEDQLKAHDVPNWETIGLRPYQRDVPKQEGTQCRLFTLKFAVHWDGETLNESDELTVKNRT
jgi:hypothetical protein